MRDKTPREKIRLYATSCCYNVAPFFVKGTDEGKAMEKYFHLAVTSMRLFNQLWEDLPSPRRERTIMTVDGLIKNLIIMDELNDFRACPKEAKTWFIGNPKDEYYDAEESDEVFYNWIVSHIY